MSIVLLVRSLEGGALRREAGLLFRHGCWLRQALIGAKDDVGADGRGVIMGDILVKRNHAGLLELALQDNFKPLIVIQ